MNDRNLSRKQLLDELLEQRRLVSELRKSNNVYRSLVENALVGIYQTNRKGDLLYVNDTWLRMFGFETLEEARLGGSPARYQNPEERNTNLKLLEQTGTLNNFAVELVTKTGEPILVLLSATLESDIITGMMMDVTERRREKKAFLESVEKYRSVVESSFVGFFIVQDHVYRFVNGGFCKISGYTYDEIVDRVNPLDIVHPDDRKKTGLNLEKRITGRTDHVEYGVRGVRKDGRIIHVKIFGTSLIYNGRRAAAGTIIDVTREKELEQQLLRTQKLEAIGTLAGGIAHDFNNILIGIIGFTEMVQDEMAPHSREYHRLGLVLKGAHQGRDLIKQILTFSRQAEHEQKPVALSGIVEEGLKMLRPLLPVTTEIRSKGLINDDTILADSAQMHQVLMNLCTNGAKAMGKKGGVLEVSVTRERLKKDDQLLPPGMKPGDYVILTVSDSGCGMKPEVLERIFDPFFTTRAHGDGTGLGLSVVHGIVKSHGGFINVESEPGKGSVFHVCLPKIERKEDPAVSEELPARGGRECVLFVDDEELTVELNNERLTQLGYEVVSTTSSLEALEIFKKEPKRFHLVITDYTMPDMTGVDLARKLLKVRNDIPIILCTGYNNDISPDKAKKAGIREFLLKPQGKRGLDLAIRRALDVRT
jgi:PAS domain S-box-containing protein